MTQMKQAISSDLVAVAERELSAFISAVTQLFGLEQARLSAKEWLNELNSMDNLPGLEIREWRLVTIMASARLASRIIDPNVMQRDLPSTDRSLRHRPIP